MGRVRLPVATVTLDDPGGQQPQRKSVYLLGELVVGPAPAGLHLDQRLVVGLRANHPVEVLADGLAEQRDTRRALRVGRLLMRRRLHTLAVGNAWFDHNGRPWRD